MSLTCIIRPIIYSLYTSMQSSILWKKICHLVVISLFIGNFFIVKCLQLLTYLVNFKPVQSGCMQASLSTGCLKFSYPKSSLQLLFYQVCVCTLLFVQSVTDMLNVEKKKDTK